MGRLFSLAVVLFSLTAFSLAAPVEQTVSFPSLNQVGADIQAELEAHGDRVLGHDVYHWSTRLERIEGCRAEFSVRLTNNLVGSVVQVESVSFSLGALDPSGIAIEKHWVQMACFDGEACFESTTTCTRKTKDGIVIDCTTPNQKQVDGFSLQLDGDAASAQRLLQDLRQAVGACREPRRVSF